MTLHTFRKAATGGFFILSLLALLFSGAAPLPAMEREEFGELLQIIPPDGLPSRYGDIFLRPPRGEGKMPPVLFPHWLHRARYTCNVCHAELGFSMAGGETRISRADYLAGRYCGVCHDGKTAFSGRLSKEKHCERCHVEKKGALDKRFREFAKDLPVSGFGNQIDWVKALEEGLIRPKGFLKEWRKSIPLPSHLKKPMMLKASSPRSESPFPHQQHVAWIECSGCHPSIFDIKKSGTELFSMDKNLYGWFCGTCHLRVSFSMLDCGRCHPYIKSKSF